MTTEAYLELPSAGVTDSRAPRAQPAGCLRKSSFNEAGGAAVAAD
jgi:hypothetical protein